MFSIFASKAGKTRKIAKQLLEFSEKVDLYRRDVIPPADLAEQLDRAAELRAKLKGEAFPAGRGGDGDGPPARGVCAATAA